MPLQTLSGVDIALWEIAGKAAGLPIHSLLGGVHRDDVPAYGYGMMLKRESVDNHCARFFDELRRGPSVNISGGEAEFTRWGWRRLLEARALDIAQPEVCALGGISEYQRVLALCHAHFTTVVNHAWGSAVAVACNLHLLAAQPPLHGGLHPSEPMLEFDTIHNSFRDDLLIEWLYIQGQVARGGRAVVPTGSGLRVTPDPDMLACFAWNG